MGDAFKKVQAGQKLDVPAEAWNAFLDAARAERSRRHNVAQDAGEEFRQTGIVKVRNDTGANQPRYAVLALRDPIITPEYNEQEFKHRVTFVGEKPAAPVKCERFAVLLEPLRAGKIGCGVVAGVTPVRVDVVRETDRFAELVEDVTAHLRSSAFGLSRVLWKEEGTGQKWAVVRLGDRPRLAVFELVGTWQPGTGGSEPDGWAKMPGCKPVLYTEAGATYAPDTDEPTETVWHAVGYVGPERDSVISLHQSAGVFPAKFGAGDRVWCFFDEHDGRWQILGGYEDHWRFKLTAELARCGSAEAQLVLFNGGSWTPADLTFTVHDSLGVVCPCLCKPPEPTEGEEQSCEQPGSVPAGTYGIAKYFADSGRWEAVALGEGCESTEPPPADPPGIEIKETDVRCEDKKLNVYTRTVTLRLKGCCLVKTAGEWEFSHQAGCCCCENCTEDPCAQVPGAVWTVTGFTGACAMFNGSWPLIDTGGGPWIAGPWSIQCGTTDACFNPPPDNPGQPRFFAYAVGGGHLAVFWAHQLGCVCLPKGDWIQADEANPGCGGVVYCPAGGSGVLSQP